MATIHEAQLVSAGIRDRPINAPLRRVLLEAATHAGVDVVRVVSGGQPGTSGRRIGSQRHDGGAAADIELICNGRALNFTIPGDADTICRFVAAAAWNGATGIGAGVDYMGPNRLHVGFGNGPADTARVVWGAGGLPGAAPDWLRQAAWGGWTRGPGAPGPAPAFPPAGEVDPGPPAAPDVPVDDPLERRFDELGAYSARAEGIFDALARGAITLVQYLRGRPVTGAPDPDMLAALARYAPYFRAAGWIVGTLGAIGLVDSAVGSSLDSQLQAFDRFRAMLGRSVDPGLDQALDQVRQGVEAIKPTLQDLAAEPAAASLLRLLGALVPGPAGSLLAAGLGLSLHRLGASLERSRMQASAP